MSGRTMYNGPWCFARARVNLAHAETRHVLRVCVWHCANATGASPERRASCKQAVNESRVVHVARRALQRSFDLASVEGFAEVGQNVRQIRCRCKHVHERPAPRAPMAKADGELADAATDIRTCGGTGRDAGIN